MRDVIMEKNELDKLHHVLVEILDYFVSICEKNGLTYFLVYGTALGAYRHHGFIPWDDDLDVAMPREDYEALIKIMDNQPNSDYQIQYYKNEPNWFLSFSKIRKSNTLFIEDVSQNLYNNNGIYIDIFPLDSLNKCDFKFYLKKIIVRYLRHSLKFNSCRALYKSKENKVRYIIDSLLSFPVSLIPKKKMISFYNRVCLSKVRRVDATYISECDNEVSMMIPADYYFPPCRIKFEDKEYNAPGKIELYLEKIYGKTYMQLPPINERHTHQPIKIEF